MERCGTAIGVSVGKEAMSSLIRHSKMKVLERKSKKPVELGKEILADYVDCCMKSCPDILYAHSSPAQRVVKIIFS